MRYCQTKGIKFHYFTFIGLSEATDRGSSNHDIMVIVCFKVILIALMDVKGH